MAKRVLIHNLSEPLRDVNAAKFDINTGTGNLVIDQLTGAEDLLASGALEYLEKQDPPAWTVDSRDRQAILTLKASGGRQPGFRLPWSACNGETNWEIQINPAVPADVTARSGGGNVKLNLAGMAVTRVTADSGGGNMDVVLPEGAADLSVTARTGGGNISVEFAGDTTGSNAISAISGAGNVAVRLPAGVAALIHAATGMGKVIVDQRFCKVDKDNYQSPDYDSAVDRVEIIARSGAGNVSVIVK